MKLDEASMFARAEYLVVNVRYRVAPQHPFPPALTDCVDALAWVADHAAGER